MLEKRDFPPTQVLAQAGVAFQAARQQGLPLGFKQLNTIHGKYNGCPFAAPQLVSTAELSTDSKYSSNGVCHPSFKRASNDVTERNRWACKFPEGKFDCSQSSGGMQRRQSWILFLQAWYKEWDHQVCLLYISLPLRRHGVVAVPRA